MSNLFTRKALIRSPEEWDEVYKHTRGGDGFPFYVHSDSFPVLVFEIDHPGKKHPNWGLFQDKMYLCITAKDIKELLFPEVPQPPRAPQFAVPAEVANAARKAGKAKNFGKFYAEELGVPYHGERDCQSSQPHEFANVICTDLPDTSRITGVYRHAPTMTCVLVLEDIDKKVGIKESSIKFLLELIDEMENPSGQ